SREVAVHAPEQRDAHDERVGQRGEGEERDGPVQVEAAPPPAAEVAPRGEHGQHHELLQRVGGDEAQVHGVGVVGGDEVEGQQRHREERHEAVDPGALVRREDAPPPHRPVRQDHRHVQRHHGRHHVVQVRRRNHLALLEARSISRSVSRPSFQCNAGELNAARYALPATTLLGSRNLSFTAGLSAERSQ
uniref:Uncharacterized protein n=1 Tax=Zea mays TaxID=4577 RepID=A0A804NXX5_MAIZE